MKQLIYRSEPFGFDRATLAGILMDARQHNNRDGITGALMCRHDLYIQLIEGPSAKVHSAYARIAVDRRHCNVRFLLADTVNERMFPGWDMLHDETPSLTWSESEVAEGAIEAASPAELRSVFARLSAAVASRAPTLPESIC